MKELNTALIQRQQDHLYRTRLIADSAQQPEFIADGKRVIAFCSNDYLGLSNHPTISKAMIQGIKHWGNGSGASHLINGYSRAHHLLEEALAEFTGRSRALLFSTGYMANIGVVNALLGNNDNVYEDKLNHASLLDAGLLSKANFKRYLHCDVNSLISRLKNHQAGRKLIISDGVFSMDGDLAPLPKLVKTAEKTNAWLMIDDAHGMGVLGKKGGGIVSHFNCDQNDVPILVGTFGKAFGTFGAFVAGSESLIETLIQHSRTYIYTTAPPAAIAEATRESLKIVQNEDWRREQLFTHIQYFKQQAKSLGLTMLSSITPIQAILVGSSEKALKISQFLIKHGILIPAIRPPTVANNTARLRITFSAQHTQEHIDFLLEKLIIAFKQHGET